MVLFKVRFMVLTTMERACARNVGGVVEGCE